MKKAISVFICCCVLCLQLPFSACFCNHEWTFCSDTTTCEADGVVTYRCDVCGETKEEKKTAYGHKWEKTSSTATCLQDGFYVYTCKNCSKTKNEGVKASGHSFNYKGNCEYCGKFKYNIQLSNSLPEEFYYGRYNYVRAKIEKIEIEILSSDVYVCFYGQKTYDNAGAYGDTLFCIRMVLYDSTGNIMANETVNVWDKIVGQKFTKGGDIIYAGELSTEETYTLKIVNAV